MLKLIAKAENGSSALVVPTPIPDEAFHLYAVEDGYTLEQEVLGGDNPSTPLVWQSEDSPHGAVAVYRNYDDGCDPQVAVVFTTDEGDAYYLIPGIIWQTAVETEEQIVSEEQVWREAIERWLSLLHQPNSAAHWTAFTLPGLVPDQPEYDDDDEDEQEDGEESEDNDSPEEEPDPFATTLNTI